MAMYSGIKLVIPDMPFALIFTFSTLILYSTLIELALYVMFIPGFHRQPFRELDFRTERRICKEILLLQFLRKVLRENTSDPGTFYNP